MHYTHPDREALIREHLAGQDLFTMCKSSSISERRLPSKPSKHQYRRNQKFSFPGAIDLTSPTPPPTKANVIDLTQSPLPRKRKSEEPEIRPVQNLKKRRSRDTFPPRPPLSSLAPPTAPRSSPPRQKIISGSTLRGTTDHLTRLAYAEGCVPTTWQDRNASLPQIPPTEPLWTWKQFDQLPLGAWDDDNGHEYENEDHFWEAWQEGTCDEKLECYEVRGLEEGVEVYESGGRERMEMMRQYGSEERW